MVAVVLIVHAVAVLLFNYALHTPAVAAAVLTLADLAQPTDYSAEGSGVLSTLCGVAIGLAVMLLGGVLARRGNATPQPARA
jgi:uncharacterized membrane protein YccC